ncbi:MarC family protein [Sphingorhabdus sp. EL138]|uniref:MarC family protein n=1 Tax=Sphingorhabdus sp. EL138 TaxID=2073156 RepID=UPI000D6948BB|nr:MarC family protein [Sphingorhabdus sp. EL138]
MTELFVSALITFFVAIDPPGCAAIYASMTTDAGPRQRRAMAFRAIFVATIILLIFGFFGEALLHAMGVSLDSFRIAGGIMLFIIAIEMVFEKRTERREGRAQEIIDTPEIEDVSIFPMAMPMIAGPGSIAALMLFIGRSDGWNEQLVVLAAMGAILLVMLVSMLAAGPLMKILGQKVETVITRVLGVILAALAIQFVVDGIKASFL